MIVRIFIILKLEIIEWWTKSSLYRLNAKKYTHRRLFLTLALSDYLCDNRMLRKDEISKLVNAAICQKIDFIENGCNLFYRNHLKNEIKNADKLIPEKVQFDNVISLNKSEE